MATDFGEKERAFIDGLKENTGRDLAEWMQEIAASGQVQRNDIIDWLRHKGLMFSRASWLERIHHNGGKPIYADAPKDAAALAPAGAAARACWRRRCRPLRLPPTPPAPVRAATGFRTGAGQRRRRPARQGQGLSPAGAARAGEDQVGAARRQLHRA